MKFRTIHLSCLAALSLYATLLPSLAMGQSTGFPTKALTMVVPYGAGTSLDNIIRLVSTGMAKELGQPVILQNRPGAGGMIGTSYVAKQAPADGHVLLFTVASIATYQALDKNLTFDPVNDLAPASIVYEQPYLFTTNKLVPATNFKQFVAYAKANPGKLHYGSSGRSITMLTTEAFLKRMGLDMTQVPFSKLGDINVALLRNDIQLYTPGVTSVVGQIRAGDIVPLFVSGKQRLAALPEVPTSAEVGIADFSPTVWGGVFAPGGTSAATVERISASISATLAQPANREALIQREGVEPVGSTPAEARQVVVRDLNNFTALAKRLHLDPE